MRPDPPEGIGSLMTITNSPPDVGTLEGPSTS